MQPVTESDFSKINLISTFSLYPLLFILSNGEVLTNIKVVLE